MATSLHPCPTCLRHVRTTETICPLCGAAISSGFSPLRRAPLVAHGQLTRAMVLVGAASSAACFTLVASSYGNPCPCETVDAGTETVDAGDARAETGSDAGAATDAGVGPDAQGD